MASTLHGDPTEAPSVPIASVEESYADESGWAQSRRRILGVGKPLMLGLAIMATAVGITTYILVSVAWKRHRRRN